MDEEKFWQAHEGKVYKVLLARCGHTGTAEELTSEAFRRLYKDRKKPDLDSPEAERWVFQKAMNVLTEHERKQKTKRKQQVTEVSVEEVGDFALGDNEGYPGDRDFVTRVDLETVVASMRERDQWIIARVYAGLTNEQLGALLHMTAEGARQATLDTLRRLRNLLES